MKKEWVTNCHRGEVQEHFKALSGILVEGNPKTTPHCTQSRLKEMGMVGIYRLIEEGEAG